VIRDIWLFVNLFLNSDLLSKWCVDFCSFNDSYCVL